MPGPETETPLFVRFHDLLLWLVPRVESFPRSQRFLLAQRILDAAYSCHAQLIRARKTRGEVQARALLEADVALEEVRLSLRLAHELRCLTVAQYEHGARLVDEVGRLLGRWRTPQPGARPIT